MEQEHALGDVVGVHGTRVVGRDGFLIFTLVDSTWELNSNEFFAEKEQMLAAAGDGDIAVELWIPSNGGASTLVASYRIEKK